MFSWVAQGNIGNETCNIGAVSRISKNFAYQRQLSTIVLLSKTLIKPQLDSMVLLFNVIRPRAAGNETQQRRRRERRKVIDDFNCLSISRIVFSIKTSLRICRSHRLA